MSREHHQSWYQMAELERCCRFLKIITIPCTRPATHPPTTPFPRSGADLYPLHLQESGHLKSLLPDEQLTVQLHAEEHVLPCLRLHAEAVLPLVQKIIILGGESAARQEGSGWRR